MYYDKDKFEPFPDMRDPVTGDWLPMSESEKAKILRSAEQKVKSESEVGSILASIFK